MRRPPIEILDHARGFSDRMARHDICERAGNAEAGTILALIRDRGGRITPSIDQAARIQIARIAFAGIEGEGPGLLGAARDWRRKAAASLRP
ncbi:hypothetical protein [Salipiger bermudensis]|uniref:Uncharacterized protein n=1 Tax=Salipiger bermudensis (strain DSM 26914 / JCM 13377 / KCTC 12554 / HTCC2601) TaxID=314265 RepID=Q0FLK5_SALBH|nr:hypothetical protein [Salipiger bermudensis]EAU45093.1 hypothetical protein R2601_22941 [Salipiger bermudensis HTCC2601]